MAKHHLKKVKVKVRGYTANRYIALKPAPKKKTTKKRTTKR